MAAILGFVEHRRVDGGRSGSAMPLCAEPGDLAEVVVFADPFEGYEEVLFDGEHAVQVGEVGLEEVGEGFGPMDEGEEGVDAEDLGAAQVVAGQTWQGGPMPDDTQAGKGGESLVADLMEEVVVGELEGKAEGVHARAVETRHPRLAGQSLTGKFPGELALLLCGQECHG